MKTHPKIKAAIAMAISACSIAAATSASAHDLWLEVRDGKAVLIEGHVTGNADERAYEPFRFVNGLAFDASMERMPIDISHKEGTAQFGLNEMPSMITAHFNGGFWSRSKSQGWVRKPGTEVEDEISSMYSLKFARLYLRPLSDPSQRVGHPLEMVPLSDPSTLNQGDTFEVRVTLFGQPLADAEVVNDLHGGADAAVSKTNASGIARITVPSRPLAIAKVNHKVGLSDDPHVATLSLASSIAYEPGQ